MAFKIKRPGLYNGMGAKGAIKTQKDYAGQADGRATSSPFQQRVTKGGEGQDENKIFDKDGNHIGDWVDGKKVMKKKPKSKKE